MVSLKRTFNDAAFGHSGSDTFWLLIWIIFIIDETQRREERRRKRQRDTAQTLRPPKGPERDGSPPR